MVVQTQSWDSDLDWLTKTKEMKPEKDEKKASVGNVKSDESVSRSQTITSEEKIGAREGQEEYNPYDYSQDEFEDDADADFELDQMRTEEEKMELEENTMRNIIETEADGDNYSVHEKMKEANEELKSTKKTPSRRRKVLFKPKLVEFKKDEEEAGTSSDDDARAETPERKVLFTEDSPREEEEKNDKSETTEQQEDDTTSNRSDVTNEVKSTLDDVTNEVVKSADSDVIDEAKSNHSDVTDEKKSTEKETKDVDSTHNGVIRSHSPAVSDVSTLEIDGTKVKKTEKVLVERDGKFQLVELRELEAILPPLKNTNNSSNKKPDLSEVVSCGEKSSPAKEVQGSEEKDFRPTSAPVKKHTPKPPKSRPKSAHYNAFEHRKFKIKSNQQTFVLSPEMKEVMKKRAAKKKQKEEEEEKQRQAEEEAKKEAAAKAWQAWKARKEEGIKLKKHMTKNEEEEKKKAEKDPSESAQAYDRWYKMKTAVEKKQQRAYEMMKEEEERQFKVRTKVEADRAYKCWLRTKNAEMRLLREQNELLRKESNRIMRKERKARRMLEQIEMASDLKYIDAYYYHC